MGFELINGKATNIKDPEAILDYTWDWTDWLNKFQTPEVLSSHQIILANSLTAAIVGSTISGNKVIAIISGGAVGDRLAATCRITTAGGKVDDYTLYLKIKHK